MIQSYLRHLWEKPASKPWRTVRDAIHDLPDPEREPLSASAFLNHRSRQVPARTMVTREAP